MAAAGAANCFPFRSLCFLFLFLFPFVTCVASAVSLDETQVSLIAMFDYTAYGPMSELALAYSLQKPDIEINIAPPAVAATIEGSIFGNNIDFAISSDPLNNEEASQHSNLSMFPVMASAVVPVYRLDALDIYAPTLVFRRSVLADIFRGNISMWNDPQIAADNPTVPLPPLPITPVVLGDVGYMNEALTRVLGLFSTAFATQITISNDPVWPMNTVKGHGPSGVPSRILTNNGAIGFTPLSIAKSLGVKIGRMINRAGKVVEASTSSINFALVELSTASLADTSQVQGSLDLLDPVSSSAWPIVITQYMYVDRVVSRGSCAMRSETVQFLLWLLQSQVVTDILQSFDTISMPALVKDQLQIVDSLSNAVLCNGNRAYTGEASEMQIQMGGSPRLGSLGALMVSSYQNLEDNSVNYAYSTLDDVICIDKVARNELELALVDLQTIEANSLSALRSTQSLLLLPQLLTHLVIKFNPFITPAISMESDNIIVTFDLLSQIMTGEVSYWAHPSLLAYNPLLARRLNETCSAPNECPIILSVACTAGVNVFTDGRALFSFLLANSPHFQSVVAQFPPSVTSSWCTFLSALQSSLSPSLHFIPSTYDSETECIVSSLEGSLTPSTQTTSPTDGGMFLIQQGEGPVIFPTLQTMEDCAVAAFRPGTVEMDLSSPSAAAVCYPFTTVMHSVSASSFAGADVLPGNKSLALTRFLATAAGFDRAMSSKYLLRLGKFPFIQSAIMDKLNGVLCDGNTCLVVLPVYWALAAGIADFAGFFSTLGLVATAICMFILIKYRSRPVMRSSSVPFVAVSLCGVGFLFISTILLVNTGTSSAACSAWSWVIHSGFTLTFSPLALKTWRVYSIFGKKQLRVVKISNQQLFAYVGICWGIDLLLHLIWQAAGEGMSIGEVTRQENSRAYIYMQCSVPSNSVSVAVFSLLLALKAVLIVASGVLAFTVRKVSSAFNESQQQGMIIYNVIFSLMVIVPIILFIGAVGNILILLLTFLSLWVSYFTIAVLFIPKVLILRNPEADVFFSDHSSHRVITNGFPFASVFHMTPALLIKYSEAVQQHMQQIRQRLALLASSDRRGERETGTEGEEFSKRECSVYDSPRCSMIGDSPGGMGPLPHPLPLMRSGPTTLSTLLSGDGNSKNQGEEDQDKEFERETRQKEREKEKERNIIMSRRPSLDASFSRRSATMPTRGLRSPSFPSPQLSSVVPGASPVPSLISFSSGSSASVAPEPAPSSLPPSVAIAASSGTPIYTVIPSPSSRSPHGPAQTQQL